MQYTPLNFLLDKNFAEPSIVEVHGKKKTFANAVKVTIIIILLSSMHFLTQDKEVSVIIFYQWQNLRKISTCTSETDLVVLLA